MTFLFPSRFLEKSSNNQSNSQVRRLKAQNQIQDVYDYIELDKENLLRDPQNQPTGLLNLGNTCYLNALLQIFYNINYLRDKVLNYEDNTNNKFITALRKLFGNMCRSKFSFIDPSQVLSYLQQSHPDVFIPGIQNDFGEVFSLIVEELDQSFKNKSQEQRKGLSKLFYGSLRTIIKADKQINKQSKFGVISLDISEGCFEKALEAYRSYEISDFITQEKKRIKAMAQIIFTQTPALMIFYINRVKFQGGQLVKDSRMFDFDRNIYISKKKSKTSSGIQETSKNGQKRKKQLQEWVKSIETQLNNLKQNMKYFLSKEQGFSEIKYPTVQNPESKEHYEIAKKYIKAQIQSIQKKIIETNKQIKEIQNQRQKKANDEDAESYTLLALMIHMGKTAKSGHYKILIKTTQSKWFQFNDKIVTQVKDQKIDEYKKNGEVCCLFYRRKSLVCDSSKLTVSASLKKQITEEENNLKKKIDKGRIAQFMLRIQENASDLAYYESKFAKQNSHLFYLKPALYLISQKKSQDILKNAIIAEKYETQEFVVSVRHNLFDPDTNINLPVFQLDLPKQYLEISQKIKKILNEEKDFSKIKLAYQGLLELAQYNVKDKQLNSQLRKIISIIFMKGVFYYSMCVDCRFDGAEELSKILTHIMQAMNEQSDFLIPYLDILSKVSQNYNRLKGQKIDVGIDPKKKVSAEIGSYSDLFSKRFSHWIKRFQNIDKIENSILESDRKLYTDYIEEQQE